MRRTITVAACAFAAAVALAAGAKTTLDAQGVVVNGATIRETERRVFADGMAMRYIRPEGERRVEREDTVWTLPADAKVWYQEYGMDYEKPYCSSLVRDIPAGTVMNFPVTAKRFLIRKISQKNCSSAKRLYRRCRENLLMAIRLTKMTFPSIRCVWFLWQII